MEILLSGCAADRYGIVFIIVGIGGGDGQRNVLTEIGT